MLYQKCENRLILGESMGIFKIGQHKHIKKPRVGAFHQYDMNEKFFVMDFEVRLQNLAALLRINCLA